jgi:hypothetical protein
MRRLGLPLILVTLKTALAAKEIHRSRTSFAKQTIRVSAMPACNRLEMLNANDFSNTFGQSPRQISVTR